MAYTMILVDDEDEVRGRIASKIEVQNEFKIIGSASNGYDAIDLIEEQMPDVLVTDIKMPFMDGMELIRIVRERFPTVRVAIISGYDDYTYLKEAINLDVAAYLSKPISDNSIREFLDKIKTNLDEERKQINLKENMVQTQIRNRYIIGYLEEGTLREADKRYAGELGIDMDATYVVSCTQLMESSTSIIEDEKKKNQCLLMTEELACQVFESYLVIRGRQVISVIKIEPVTQMKELDILLNKISKYIKKYLSLDTVMGVSNAAPFESLQELYRQSRVALEGFDPTDSSGIIYYSSLNLQNRKRTLSPGAIREFRNNLQYMSGKDFNFYAKELENKIIEAGDYDLFSIIITLSGLMMAYANSLETKSQNKLGFDYIKTYMETGNVKGFMAKLTDWVIQVKSDTAAAKTQKSIQTIRDIKHFVEKQYMNPELSMDMVSEQFHISISYLGTLFKKETGTTFNRYLVAKRIEQAKWLLRNSDDKMVIVAEKCGYKDVYYFSHSFKKVVGMTPKGFRKYED